MPESKTSQSIPDGYVRLEGSERRAPKKATLLGPVDDNEKFSVTIALRRRPDGPPMPDFDYFVNTPPNKRMRLSADEFTEKYGAHPGDIKKVVDFAERSGLQVTKTHAGRRTIRVSGTASQFSRAFGVTFGRYQQPARPDRFGKKLPPLPAKTYRGRDGFVLVPKELADAIVGVFGLDNRPVSIRGNNPGDPPIINPLPVNQVTQLYNFPSPGMAIAGQTIGIISPSSGGGGFFQDDINQTYSALGLTPPQVIPISVEPGATNGCVDAVTTGTAPAGATSLTFPLTAAIQTIVGSYVYPVAGIPDETIVATVTPAGTSATVALETWNGTAYVPVSLGAGGVPSGTKVYFDSSPNATGETNQDILISTLAAQGANVAVYFTDDTQDGWVDLVGRALLPEAGDLPAGVNPPTVLSASWAIAPGDDPDGLSYSDTYWGTGITTNTLQAMTAAFQDAAVLQTGPTICICSGDFGTNQGVGRSTNYPTNFTQLITNQLASPGQDVLNFTSTTGVSVGAIGSYSDPVTGVWYFVKATAVTGTTVTVQVLDNATQAWVNTGFYDNIPVGTTINFNLGLTGDGYAHVWYPGSDPWVLCCGGTTIGQYYPQGSTTPAWVEYAWNDAFQQPNGWGTGGGGVSDFFPLPSYQNNAGVPKSINPTLPTNPDLVTVTPPAPFNATGRGVPDVASNASIFSGFSGFYQGGQPAENPGNGTSAAAPLWAGLVAVLNSNAGFNIGFLNPTLYSLGPGAFNPINPLWPDPAYPQLAACPVDNSNNGIPGYPTGPGWDACTGLGSPNAGAILTALQELDSVYILGGYQSPDIVITDLTTMKPIAIGGAPGGSWDTLLAPNTSYGFSANVHNDSSSDVNNVQVSFWAIPGGVGTMGNPVGTPQTVSIAAHTTKTVQASAPFVSAGPGGHLCAVVSIYCPAGGCDTDATNAVNIPDPGYSATHGCSAWRNTDSSFAHVKGPIKFPVGLGKIPIRLIDPIVLHVQPTHVPVDWDLTSKATTINDILRAVGAQSNIPLYLLPGFTRAFPKLDIKPRLVATHGCKIEEREPGVWHLTPHPDAEEASIEVTAELPEGLKAGDVVLVNVAATYPRIERHPARTVEFLEFVHLTDKDWRK
jgi:hypothetical protein